MVQESIEEVNSNLSNRINEPRQKNLSGLSLCFLRIKFLSFRTVEDACPYKIGVNFLMRSTLLPPFLLMILRPLGDLVAAVHRLVQNHPHKLMRKGQLRHRQPHFGGGLDLGSEAVRGADDEAKSAAL